MTPHHSPTGAENAGPVNRIRSLAGTPSVGHRDGRGHPALPVRQVRLDRDPVPKANEKADPRRQRRAMTETELVGLLAVARERPILDALTVRKGPRRGERYANVRPEVRERLDMIGRERALIYKTLVLTGICKGERPSPTVADLSLDDALPCDGGGRV